MHRALLLLTLLLALAGAGHADAPPAAPGAPGAPGSAEVLVTLREAVAAGQVLAHGEKPSGYSRVHVRLTNLTAAPLAVDVCGARLEPETPRSCQRLGLGPSVEREATRRPRPGVVVVDLAAGETKSVPMRSCCLDLRLSIPRTQPFSVSVQPPTPVTERLLRWWADHPGARQDAVNSAIWRADEAVAWSEEKGSPAQAWSHGAFAPQVAACGGTVYQLVDGRLTALGADGARRILGAEIVRVIPTADALYAVFPISDARAELRRLALTGDDDDRWALVATLSDGDLPRSVLAVPGVGLLLVGDESILRVSQGGGEAEPLLTSQGPTSGRLEPRGGATLVTSRARRGQGWIGLTHTLAPGGRAPLPIGEYWDLREVRAGGAGVFGLTHVGNLVHLANAKPRGLGSVQDVERILFVGLHVLWLRGKDGRPFAVDPDTGREVSRPGADADAKDVEDEELALDAVSGDLVGLHGGRWFRWLARDGGVEEIAAP